MVYAPLIRLSLFLLLVIAVSACTPSGAIKVDMNRRVALDTVQSSWEREASAPPPLRLAISGLMTPEETLHAYADFIAYLEERLGRPVKLVQRGSQAQVNALMQARQVDMALYCPLPYVQGRRSFGLELLAVVVHRGKVDHYSHLLVPQNSDATSLFHLRGKTFAFSDPDSCTGWLAPTYQLALKGETPQGFFAQQIFTYTHQNNARLVARRAVDGAVIDSLAYEYLAIARPDLINRTRVLESWGPLPSPPLVVHPSLDEGLKAQLKELLINMDKDPQGQKVLSRLQMDGFSPVDDRAFDVIREMEHRVKSARGGGR